MHHEIRSKSVVKMKLFVIVFFSILFESSSSEHNKKLSKFEESFQTTPAPAELCRILLPLVYANHSEKLCLRLWETKNVKADCVFERMKNSGFIDLELKFEIYTNSNHLSNINRRKRISEVMREQREILINTAKTCKSDPTYGGLFDEILGINSSIIFMQENNCLLKYVIENKFLYVHSVNTNLKNIDTSKVECSTFILKRQNETEEKLLEAFRKRQYSSEAIVCLLQKYHDEKIFGWNVAKSFLFKLNISDSARKSEDWRISKILSDFNKKSSNCLYSFNWSLFK
ncbi:CLUMA_CG016116, isoform A [Clunio marinus]|uniref:CLUMA_CG016116, isoform A n=1 Tax=Clunio marinus TaxID=568069 RepID=A0A1J1ISQ8_9DIPT|nr:CLUMA_CG016116, isoform A [Clunio marinus]